MSYTDTFVKKVLDNSTAATWENAKTEWEHIGSHLQPESNCICGHEILEVCNIQNNINGNILEVGNVCVRKFMGIDRRNDFKLIKKDLIDSSLFSELIKNRVINEWELEFYKETKRKRKLTLKQEERRGTIIRKAKEYVMRNKRGSKAIIDPIIFKTIIDKEKMTIKKEHTKMLGDFLVAQGYKISQGKSDKTFDEVFEVLKQTIIQVKKLQDSYER